MTMSLGFVEARDVSERYESGDRERRLCGGGCHACGVLSKRVTPTAHLSRHLCPSLQHSKRLSIHDNSVSFSTLSTLIQSRSSTSARPPLKQPPWPLKATHQQHRQQHRPLHHLPPAAPTAHWSYNTGRGTACPRIDTQTRRTACTIAWTSRTVRYTSPCLVHTAHLLRRRLRLHRRLLHLCSSFSSSCSSSACRLLLPCRINRALKI